ncbi:MAG: aminotransferase class V-fold PLP-dependent enzyme [Bacteroidetes bacterium]|nr:aminotransferase class V-fold PLP-dependent enzyme [Bacteroidota bacterium]
MAAGTALTALGFGKALFSSGDVPLNPSISKKSFGNNDDDVWDSVRNEFFLGKQVYLNTGTLGLMPKAVMVAVTERLETLSRGNYALDDEVRNAVAKMLNAKASEISLTHNTTEGINIIAAGLKLRKGDELVLTDQEHVGNALPWLHRAKAVGARIRVLQPGKTANETLNRLNDLITRKTRVFALPHITCTDGNVLPAKEIADLARSKGILSFFDGAHGPGMLFPDMQAIGCDFYAACGHKWLCSPAGTGMLYLRESMLESVQARMVGAYSDTGWELSTSAQTIGPLVPTAHRFDYGTQNATTQAGMKAAIEFMDGIGFEKVRDRVLSLGNYLQSKLLEYDYVEMLTPTEAQSRGGMIGFRLRGKTMKDFEGSEIPKNFRVRLVPESGLNSIRISTHIFNNHNDLDNFVAAIDRWMKA